MLSTKIVFFGQKLIERGGRFGAWYFAPLSWIYALVVFFRGKFFDWGFFSVTKVKPVVVSVGNILAGGVGKTPFVEMLAKTFSHRRVAILSRGYGEIADEAMLLSKRIPSATVLVGKNRAELAKKLDVDLIILDDGFQHRKLYRDFDIVLDRNEKGYFLPRGFLRDFPSRLKKAIVFHTDDLALNVSRILDVDGDEIKTILGLEVGIFCGIARPERFKKTVTQLGAIVVKEHFFGDHEKADLNVLDKNLVWICTEKDIVKIKKANFSIYYLEMDMQVIGQIERWEMLVEKIDQKIDNKKIYER